MQQEVEDLWFNVDDIARAAQLVAAQIHLMPSKDDMHPSSSRGVPARPGVLLRAWSPDGASKLGCRLARGSGPSGGRVSCYMDRSKLQLSAPGCIDDGARPRRLMIGCGERRMATPRAGSRP
ncbi:hypothetical protein GCM10011504_25070 [Siccirubricoccus deserti]|nr:hypothetical protein GCM10011504_25070 [Siccirubricoccus deserti]